MNRALVIYGDKRIGGAIADGLTTKELEMVRAENRRLNAVNGVRSYGDSVRWESVSGALAAKYSTRPAKPFIGAILGVYALMWCAIFAAFAYLQERNRA